MKPQEQLCKEALTIRSSSSLHGQSSQDVPNWIFDHLENCDSCRADANLESLISKHLGHEGEDHFSGDELTRRRWVDNFLEKNPSLTKSPSRLGELNTWLVPIVSVAAVVLLAISTALLVPETIPANAPPNSGTQIPPPTSVEAEPIRTNVLLASGEMAYWESLLSPDWGFTAGKSINTQNGRIAFQAGRVAAIVDRDSSVQFQRIDSDEIRIDLKHGVFLAAVDPYVREPSLIIHTRVGDVVVTGTIFAVEVDSGETNVSVLKGQVQVLLKNGESTTVDTGERMQLDGNNLRSLAASECHYLETLFSHLQPTGDSSDRSRRLPSKYLDHLEMPSCDEIVLEEKTRPSPNLLQGKLATQRQTRLSKSSARELLLLAQMDRKEKKWVAAAQAYSVLIRRFPSSREGQAALVSLGTIELKHLGHPDKGLRLFQSYLSNFPKGMVTSEALFGKVRALRALGRTTEEKRCLSKFIERFPSSFQAGQAKQRLMELEN